MQLQSLLHRVETLIGNPVCRIGLSATLGDMSGAIKFLRPDESRTVVTIDSKCQGQELKVLVKGFVEGAESANSNPGAPEGLAKLAVAQHMFQVLRGQQ